MRSGTPRAEDRNWNPSLSNLNDNERYVIGERAVPPTSSRRSGLPALVLELVVARIRGSTPGDVQAQTYRQCRRRNIGETAEDAVRIVPRNWSSYFDVSGHPGQSECPAGATSGCLRVHPSAWNTCSRGLLLFFLYLCYERFSREH